MVIAAFLMHRNPKMLKRNEKETDEQEVKETVKIGNDMEVFR